jgi:hypothetical protein
MDLATLDTRDGRRRYNNSLSPKRDWYRRTVRRYGETNQPGRGSEPMSITCVDWIGARFQNQTEPFSLRRTCAGSAVITHVVV